LLTLEFVNQEGKTALSLAESKGHAAVVEALSKAGADEEADEDTKGEVRDRRVQGESGAVRCGSYLFSLGPGCLSRLSF